MCVRVVHVAGAHGERGDRWGDLEKLDDSYDDFVEVHASVGGDECEAL